MNGTIQSYQEENAMLRKVLAETLAAKEALDAEVERCHVFIENVRSGLRALEAELAR